MRHGVLVSVLLANTFGQLFNIFMLQFQFGGGIKHQTTLNIITR